MQRWRANEGGEDLRRGPSQDPRNKLSQEEREEVLEVATSPEFRDLPPKQIVPRLADRGIYLASEASFYRILREEKLLKHRSPKKPSRNARPREHRATGPNQVWSWDITYLPACIRGTFYYLYLILDIYSRKIVGWAVHDREDQELSAALMDRVCQREGIRRDQLTLHSDNGGPMKGATMLKMLQELGVAASFSRPSVSNDNPFSESVFGTMKYRPSYPKRPFGSIEEAIRWVEEFVRWYNHEHLHSSIGFVTPSQRHEGEAEEILSKRREVYEQARARHPERWSGDCRSWSTPDEVVLNPANRSQRTDPNQGSSTPDPGLITDPSNRSTDGPRQLAA